MISPSGPTVTPAAVGFTDQTMRLDLVKQMMGLGDVGVTPYKPAVSPFYTIWSLISIKD